MPNRVKPVKTILISQPEPKSSNTPYHRLADKHSVQVDFRSFIEVQGIPTKEFRKAKVDILSHTAIVFTSRKAVDNLFRVCQDLKIELPADMKYFCVSDQTANYLQKYITIRKRKLFVGEKRAMDLFPLFKKHKEDKFLYPCSDVRKNDIPDFFKENELSLTEAVIYRTVSSDLTDLEKVNYDMIAFFSPSGVNSLFVNFPEFAQNETRIAAFGPTTAKAVRDKGLTLDVEAPLPNAPSMTGAIEIYVKEANVN